MPALGIAVSMTPRRPVVSCVLLDGTQDAPILVDGFDLRTASDHVLAQADDLAQQLSSRIGPAAVTTAILRVADFSPRARRSSGPRSRLLIEGALAFACKQHVTDVDVRDGKEIGRALKVSKQEAEAAGAALDGARKAAASAALSALPTSS
ncbi:hypothetical protein [Micromonospora sp. WMMA1976]|uniref:hypothetical protein n=1 Tax=Micromonospora sp. WMMA1976 TaxID=3014995 RepID=UPI00248B76B0|nr:hypothetical protein [Micromonospora sp. WMMA1976]WBC01127.1 hypothetical protein O7546_18350 [Micromonospora sp. WMMA1976]